METTQFVLRFSVSPNQIPDYNPEEENLTKKILDHVGDSKNLEELISKLTEKLNLTESQVESIRKTLAEQVQPQQNAANPTSKSKKKKMKKQASKHQTMKKEISTTVDLLKMKKQASKQQIKPQLLDVANVETIEAMKKEISTTVDLLKILQHLLHKVILFPTRVGDGQVRAATRNNKISGQVRAGNKISGLVRAGNIISEQARLRKHVGNRWE